MSSEAAGKIKILKRRVCYTVHTLS